MSLRETNTQSHRRRKSRCSPPTESTDIEQPSFQRCVRKTPLCLRVSHSSKGSQQIVKLYTPTEKRSSKSLFSAESLNRSGFNPVLCSRNVPPVQTISYIYFNKIVQTTTFHSILNMTYICIEQISLISGIENKEIPVVPVGVTSDPRAPVAASRGLSNLGASAGSSSADGYESSDEAPGNNRCRGAVSPGVVRGSSPKVKLVSVFSSS